MTFFGPDLRNGLPIGLGSVAGFGIAPQFSPASLFLGGTVNGAWYDPSDSTTLFSDRAGTTPCGPPGGGSVVPVGLMLDKSQGLVLGSELVTNGDFSSGTTGWTGFAATLAVVAGELQVTPTDASSRSGYQSITTVIGGRYRVSAQYRQGTTTGVVFRVRNTAPNETIVYQSSTQTGVGTFTFDFTASVTTSVLELATASGNSGNSAFFDNVSVKQVAGNHAIAANDTTARPELSARVNLITNSENFAGTGWSGTATIATDVTTAPNGTTTADSITAAATSANQYIRRSPAGLLVNVQFAWSVAAKKNTSDWLYLRFWDTSNAGIGNAVWFNVANGTVGSSTAGTVGSITNLGDGWYRCTVTRTIGGSIAFNEIDIAVSNADNTINATAGNSVFVWGADLRPTNIGTTIPAYQRIVDANTYDAVGFPRYLVANGTSSAMSTPGNITLGVANLTQFIGLRKQADGNFPAITQFGGTRAIELHASQSTGTTGYTGVIYTTGSSTPYVGGATPNNAAPVSNVLTVSADASQTVFSNALQMRVNGVSQTLSALNSGVYVGGTFGSAPLRIGARDTTSLFLTGNIYSLIVVGSAVSAGQITSTEQWVAGKVGITI